MNWVLNWKELENYVNLIRPHVEGLFVDRVIIPHRPKFPEEYIKDEWAIRLNGKKDECVLIFSVRPRHPYLTWERGKGPKASTQATQSPFGLSISKHLKGSRLRQIVALPRERTVVLWFDGDSQTSKRLGLVLTLTPAVPEACLVALNDLSAGEALRAEWPILSHNRQGKTTFVPPDGSNAPANLEVRQEILVKPGEFSELMEKERDSEAFGLRLQRVEKITRQALKHARDRLRQSETAIAEAEKEKNWGQLGDWLKGSLGDPSAEMRDGMRILTDYNTGERISVPIDPKLGLQEQIEKYYQNARRKQRRISEAEIRAKDFRKTVEKMENLLSQKLSNKPSQGQNQPGIQTEIWHDWQKLEKWESLVGLSPQAGGAATAKRFSTSWSGKAFMSKDGSPIWVGRSIDENLELTFKSARGNDMWMHLRGRPGAHIIIPLAPGKSASLETLLDAAQLTLHYSKGSGWGKTEIDYTFKKYVKRIKNSKEVSYTNNKTILVEPDSARLKRLLDQAGTT